MPKQSTTVVQCLIAILLLAAPAETQAQDWGEVTDEEWNLSPPVAYPEADAVVIFDIGYLEINTEQITLDRHVRLKIFNKAGAEDVSSIEIYRYDDDKLKRFKAQTIHPDGKKKKVKEKFEKEIGGLKTLTFTFPAVENGVILEYQYRLIHRRYNFIDPWYFQSYAYMLKSEFAVELQHGFSYRVTYVNVPPDKREATKETDVRTKAGIFTWSLEGLPPLRDEPLIGGRNSNRVSLYFQLAGYQSPWSNITFGRDWPDLGELLADDIDKFCDDKKRISATARAISAGAADQEERIIRLYRWVRDSIETRDDLSTTYYDDDRACDLLDRKHGTTVEKNTLLVLLLQSLGIEAHPMMIGTRDFAGFNPNVYQLRQFNHIICCLHSDSARTSALDTGDRTVSYPHLPSRALASGGLLINGEESQAVMLTHADRKSGAKIDTRVAVSEEGAAACTAYVWVVGYEMSKYESFLRDSLSRQELGEEWLKMKSDKAVLSSISADCDLSGDSLCLRLAFEIPEFATVVDGNYFFPSFVFPFTNPFEDERRFFPVDFRYPFFKNYTTTFSLPEGVTVADVPPDAQHQIAGGLFVRRAFASPASVSVSTMLNIEKPVFQPYEYSKLKDLFDKWKDAESDQIALANAP